MTKIPPHPAKFSPEILNELRRLLHAYEVKGELIDPFAGVGLIHQLSTSRLKTVGIELEPEWAAAHPHTCVGDALKLPFANERFDAAATSCCYANRLADSHNAKDGSKRITYKHSLGRDLSTGNAGSMQWGPKYQEFHTAAWEELKRVLRPGGIFFLNISNHIRSGREMPVVEWHLHTLIDLEFYIDAIHSVATKRLRFGANRDARVDAERIIVARKS